MIVKINRGAFGVGLSHYSHSVLLVPYGLPFDQCLHNSLPWIIMTATLHDPHRGDALPPVATSRSKYDPL